jgi:uncharacterized protein DUF664
VISPPSDGPAARGIVRLLNTAGGRVLCLAGEVDRAAVESFLRRYGREPVQIDGIDAGSVTALSAPGLELVLDHLDAAGRAGRPVALHRLLSDLIEEYGPHSGHADLLREAVDGRVGEDPPSGGRPTSEPATHEPLTVVPATGPGAESAADPEGTAG